MSRLNSIGEQREFRIWYCKKSKHSVKILVLKVGLQVSQIFNLFISYIDNMFYIVDCEHKLLLVLNITVK